MVNIDDLIKSLSDPELIEKAVKTAREIVIGAEAEARCTINDYNNAVYARFCKRMGESLFSRGY